MDIFHLCPPLLPCLIKPRICNIYTYPTQTSPRCCHSHCSSPFSSSSQHLLAHPPHPSARKAKAATSAVYICVHPTATKGSVPTPATNHHSATISLHPIETMSLLSRQTNTPATRPSSSNALFGTKKDVKVRNIRYNGRGATTCRCNAGIMWERVYGVISWMKMDLRPTTLGKRKGMISINMLRGKESVTLFVIEWCSFSTLQTCPLLAHLLTFSLSSILQVSCSA
jgi:hypothetical protein